MSEKWDPSQDVEPWSGKVGEINAILPSGHLAIEDQRQFLPKIVDLILEGAENRDWYGKMRRGVHSLKNYMDLKHSVPSGARVVLIKCLYKTVTEECDHLDQYIVKVFAQVACLLLKKKESLPQLVLPWRGLYDIMQRLFFGKSRTSQTPLCRNLAYYLVSLAKEGRRYFHDGCNDEILAALRPFFCPQDMSILKAQGFLCLFLRRQMGGFRGGGVEALSCVREAMAYWTWIVSYRFQSHPCHKTTPMRPLRSPRTLAFYPRPHAIYTDPPPRAPLRRAVRSRPGNASASLKRAESPTGIDDPSHTRPAPKPACARALAGVRSDWDLHWVVLLSSLCRHTYIEFGHEWEPLVPIPPPLSDPPLDDFRYATARFPSCTRARAGGESTGPAGGRSRWLRRRAKRAHAAGSGSPSRRLGAPAEPFACTF